MATAWLEKRKREEYNFYCLSQNIGIMLSGEKQNILTYRQYIEESFKDSKPLEDDMTRKEKADKAVKELKDKFLKEMG